MLRYSFHLHIQICNLSSANEHVIKESLSGIDWEKCLTNLDANKQIDVLTNTIRNVFRNFVPNEIIFVTLFKSSFANHCTVIEKPTNMERK